MPTSSRQPYSDIHRALLSIKDTADNFGEVEILLRIDEDDEPRLLILPELEQKYGAKAVIGPRHSGYNSMPVFVEDLVKVASGKWCWLFDDDAWISGPWQERLREMPMETGVNSEYYNLGFSCYLNKSTEGPAGICVPTDLVKDQKLQCPVDDHWLRMVLGKEWTVKLMRDVHYYHDGRAR
jgi:hypothetical protein